MRKMVHVPYKGGAPAATGLIAGHAAVMFNNVITAMPQVKSGRLRALAVTTAGRSPALPEAPTVAESGYPGFESNSWQGIVTRAGTPGPIVARLNSEAVRVLQLPEVRNPIVSQGNDIAASSPEGRSSPTCAAKWTNGVRLSRLPASAASRPRNAGFTTRRRRP